MSQALVAGSTVDQFEWRALDCQLLTQHDGGGLIDRRGVSVTQQYHSIIIAGAAARDLALDYIQ